MTAPSGLYARLCHAFLVELVVGDGVCVQVTCTQKQPPMYTFGIKHSQYAGEIMNPPLDEESTPCVAVHGPL